MKLIAFKPFTSAANALEQINAVSESQVGCRAGRITHSQRLIPPGAAPHTTHSAAGARVRQAPWGAGC